MRHGHRRLAGISIAALCLSGVLLSGCNSKIGPLGSSQSDTPKGTEAHLVLIYFDDSSSVDTSGPKETSRRKEYFDLAMSFIGGLHPKDASNVAVGLASFQANVNPLADLRLTGKQGVYQTILDYKQGKSGRDPDLKGTSMLAVLNDAKSRIAGCKQRPRSITILILTDGGTEDQKGGDLGAFEAGARDFGGTPGMHLAVAGITNAGNGIWPRFLKRAFSGHEDSVKLGKNKADSQAVVQWAVDQFNESASR